MALDQKKYERKHTDILRDVRPMSVRMADWLSRPSHSTALFICAAGGLFYVEQVQAYSDTLLLICLLYFWWLTGRSRALAFKLPMAAARRKWKDGNNVGPGRSGKPEGILYLGNTFNTNEEAWFSNSDARTHILYLGTTGAGKTVGLQSMVANALSWGSGFVYIDGKADTDLWSSLSSLVRRFGRDDDLLVLNYMTGNSDVKSPSNTMNPFSSGSSSYLTNMLVSLMPDAEGDNAMWKERAVALASSLMPVLTWKRDNQDLPMSVSTIRKSLTLPSIIALAREQAIPERVREGLRGYLATLPGFMDAAFDDNGNLKPMGPDQVPVDYNTISNQHGYLTMQFTRSLQSLGDEYGYIFDTQAADVNMVDVVLNRRILVVLIPALEKSNDEIANLGKIVAATIKGMMGSTLGSGVEGDSATVIENKPTRSATPFMTVFDEVGYYTAQGMAVMAAQARSLGFCLVFSGQDLPAMRKRVREEANSITANCNIKIFGKLEDPTDTKDFFDKTVGSAIVTELSGFQMSGKDFKNYMDTKQAGVQLRPRASYDGLRAFKEGEAVITFGDRVCDVKIFYSNPGFAKAMRVTRYMALPTPDDNIIKNANAITRLRDLMVHKTWTAEKADVALDTEPEIKALRDGYLMARRSKAKSDLPDLGIAAVIGVYALNTPISLAEDKAAGTATATTATSGGGPSVAAAAPPAAPPPAAPEPLRAENPAAVPPPIFQKKPAGDTSAAPPPQSPATAPAAPIAPPQQAATTPPPASQGNPMSFFSKPKGDTEPPAAMPAATPPAAPASQDPAAVPPAATTGNPMSFFSKPKSAEPPLPPQAPVSWQDLVNTPDPAAPPEPPAASPPPAAETPPDAQRKLLSGDAEDILRKKADEAGKTLFKKGSDTDAAE